MRRRFDVAGRTAFVTGAARGIGAASAERLHARGPNVALVGLEPQRLEELAVRLGDVPPSSRPTHRHRAVELRASVDTADAEVDPVLHLQAGAPGRSCRRDRTRDRAALGAVWAPRYVGPMLTLRGVLQPLSELQVSRSKDLGCC